MQKTNPSGSSPSSSSSPGEAGAQSTTAKLLAEVGSQESADAAVQLPPMTEWSNTRLLLLLLMLIGLAYCLWLLSTTIQW